MGLPKPDIKTEVGDTWQQTDQLGHSIWLQVNSQQENINVLTTKPKLSRINP
jgi:hypothetical protein